MLTQDERQQLNRAVAERRGWSIQVLAAVPSRIGEYYAGLPETFQPNTYRLKQPDGTMLMTGFAYLEAVDAWKQAPDYAGDLNLAWQLMCDLDLFDRRFVISIYKDCSAADTAAAICQAWVVWHDLNHD